MSYIYKINEKELFLYLLKIKRVTIDECVYDIGLIFFGV